MTNFSTFTFKSKGVRSEALFIPSNNLPDLPITTPFTFSFLGDKVGLCLDKQNWWNPAGGHLENQESWQETVTREAKEELGVIVSNLKLVGYIIIQNTLEDNLSIQKYPPVSILPITFSSIQSVDFNWKSMETKARNLCSKSLARELLTYRQDNNQMLEIFNFILEKRKDYKYTYDFDFIKYKISNNIPVLQNYVFCMDENQKFCVVRDKGEDHYSLPGGGCDLGETAIVGAKRELLEEAQIEGVEYKLIGSSVINARFNQETTEVFQQVRYFCKVKSISEFVPHKNGFETEERLFVSFEDLPKYVTWLQIESVKPILEIVQTFTI